MTHKKIDYSIELLINVVRKCFSDTSRITGLVSYWRSRIALGVDEGDMYAEAENVFWGFDWIIILGIKCHVGRISIYEKTQVIWSWLMAPD